MAFGNRHFAPEGASVMVVDAVSGVPADPVLVDRSSGRPLTGPGFKVVKRDFNTARETAAPLQ